MFSALKKIFSRSAPALPSEPIDLNVRAPEASPPAAAASKPATPAGSSPKPAPAIVAATPAAPESGDRVTISFGSILPLIPKELIQRLNLPGLEKQTFSLSRKKVIEQLPSGAVRVTIAELRSAAPAGLFVKSEAQDAQQIVLPLQEIIAQLPPDQLPRRAQQKRAEIPETVTPLFSAKGEQLSPVRVMRKDEANVAASTPSPAPSTPPAARRPPAAPSTPTQRPGAAPAIGHKPAASAASAPARKEAAAAPPADAERLRLPLAELAESWPDSIRLEVANQNFSNGVCAIPINELREGMKKGKLQFPWKQIRSWIEPAPGGPTVYGELLVELSLATISPGSSTSSATVNLSPRAAAEKVSVAEPTPEVQAKGAPSTGHKIAFKAPPSFDTPSPASPARAAAAPAPLAPTAKVATAKSATTKPVAAPAAAKSAAKPATALAPTAAGAPVVVFPIAVLKPTWPEALQQEIERLQLSEGSLEIPLDSIEVSLKVGKVSYPWKQLWVWLKPQPAGSPAQCNADLRIDMPLEIIAPIYLEQRPKNVAKKPATVIDIPDVFNVANAPTAAVPSAPVPAPAAVAPVPAAAAASGPRVVPETLGELFGAPDKRSWTPNEIVQNTSTLPGVLGSLIALQDGLLVASCMPPTWKTETIAAFLPQIFGRLRQYSKELDMGELVSASFGVEQGTFQVFNAGIIYFAACGRPGQPLPIPELQVIAAELSRHTK